MKLRPILVSILFSTLALPAGGSEASSGASQNRATFLDSEQLQAFPGAEGFGAKSIGGRAGKVIKVTNLNDSGSGSFRAAVTSAKPRIVVFDVSGNIDLQSDLQISNPYLTVAGQTSPGGISVSGRPVRINTHDVIVQHMRFRAGSHNVADAERHDTISVLGRNWGRNQAYNIIFDHCSISWGIDENFSISGGVTNMTIQWSIISEGLSQGGHPKGEHSKGLLVSGKYNYPTSVSLHHNYFAHNTDRSPLISAPNDPHIGDLLADVVNNVSYNWVGGLGPRGTGSARINWIHNYAKPGPNSNPLSFEIAHVDDGIDPAPLLYVNGNIGSTRLNQQEPQWNVGYYYYSDQSLSTAWKKGSPWPTPKIKHLKMTKEYAEKILSSVGATIPIRDSVDTRVIMDFLNGTGNIIENVNYPDDFPLFSNHPSPKDKDNDGMPDSWELRHGMDANTDDSALDADGNGYTNIEEYLQFLTR